MGATPLSTIDPNYCSIPTYPTGGYVAVEGECGRWIYGEILL
jgi:hypothetical protein